MHHDLETLRQLEALWQTVDHDPKLARFVESLKSDKDLKNKQLIIFTESKETGDYLFERLTTEFPGETFFFSSHGGRSGKEGVSHNPALARELIKAAFDPTINSRPTAFAYLSLPMCWPRELTCTAANILINYDLPWNPTRVLQRAGRINRLGTKHTNIYIFNFFPTTQADAHLGLEANITNKIQMFHDILGEDARYLSDGEEIGSQELFDTLNSKKAYTGEGEEGDSELMYLDMMRKIRDDQPQLFEKIKRLPKKARSGRLNDAVATCQLVTFFRIGKLKKFYLNQLRGSEEVTFFEAARLLECSPETPRHAIPADYYHMLETNKQRFQLDTLQEADPEDNRSGSRSNISYIEKRLKDKHFKNCQKFTDADDEFLAGIQKMIAQGTMAKKIAQTIKKELERTLDPLEMIAILRKHIRVVDGPERINRKTSVTKREVILSGYLIPEQV